MEFIVAYRYDRAMRHERVYHDQLDPQDVSYQNLLKL